MDKSSDESILRGSLRVNADEVLSRLGLDWQIKKDQFTAGKLTAKLLKEYESGQRSFHQETTLAGNFHPYLKRINKVKESGFYVRLIYISLESEELAKKRIVDRVRKGGHGIPDDIVEKRYVQSFKNLERVLPLCDEIRIFDNSRDVLHLVFMKNDRLELNRLDDYPYLEKYFK